MFDATTRKSRRTRRKKIMRITYSLALTCVVTASLIYIKPVQANVSAPPVPTLSASVANGAVTNAKSVSISFSGDAGNTLVCEGHATVAGNSTVGIIDPCPSSPLQFGTDDGFFTFKIRQRDSNGNYSEYVQTSWTADNTAPSAPTLTSVLRSSPSNSTAEFTFAGETYAGVVDQGFQCRIDVGLLVGNWESCQSPKSYSGLTEADHVFKVRQVDLAGNAGVQTSKSWTVNLSAGPAPTLNSVPVSGTSTSATVTFSGTGPNYECKLNNQDYETNCTSPKTYTGLADGNHTLLVRQRDANGNVSNDAETTWTVDASSPVISRQRAPLTITNSLSLSYGVEFSESVTGLDTSDFILASGSCTVSEVVQSGNTYNISLTLCGDLETVRLRLNANSVSDAHGNIGPIAVIEFPDVYTDTSRTTSVFIPQKPEIVLAEKTTSGRVTKRSEVATFADKFPLASKSQISTIELIQSSSTNGQLNMLTPKGLEETEKIMLEAISISIEKLFVPLAVVPIDVQGEIKYVVFLTRTPLINPYFLL